MHMALYESLSVKYWNLLYLYLQLFYRYSAEPQLSSAYLLSDGSNMHIIKDTLILQSATWLKK
jgi:hypothetical protein